MTERGVGIVDCGLDLVGARDVETHRDCAAFGAFDDIGDALGIRAATTARQPLSITAQASSRPKPVEQPVMNQTGVSLLPLDADMWFSMENARIPIILTGMRTRVSGGFELRNDAIRDS